MSTSDDVSNLTPRVLFAAINSVARSIGPDCTARMIDAAARAILNEQADEDVPHLTPAQQHAEELAEALRIMMDCNNAGAQLYNDHHDKFTVLLDKIKPPEPPTLAEALEALAALASVQRAEGPEDAAAEALLDRARRAGVLTK